MQEHLAMNESRNCRTNEKLQRHLQKIWDKIFVERSETVTSKIVDVSSSKKKFRQKRLQFFFFLKIRAEKKIQTQHFEKKLCY